MMNHRAESVGLSVIVINWNTKKLLHQCIASVLETASSLEHEVIVIDNCSTDNSVELVRGSFKEVRLIESKENLGFSRAANLAIRKSRGRFILIAHPDVRFEYGAITSMMSWLVERERAGIAGANLIYPDGTYNTCYITKRTLRREIYDLGFPFDRIDRGLTSLCRKAGISRAQLYYDHQNLVQSDAVWNACMMFKREVIEEIGLFDEDFFVWFADTDWCYRARRAGWEIAYIPMATVVHYERQSGSFLEGTQVRYKIDGTFVDRVMRKDLETLYRKHYGFVYRMIGSGLRRLGGLKFHI